MNRNANVENMHFTANDAKPALCAVHLGTMIVTENTLFKVVKKYNDFVWRLKSENGEIVNVFYALSQNWSTPEVAILCNHCYHFGLTHTAL